VTKSDPQARYRANLQGEVDGVEDKGMERTTMTLDEFTLLAQRAGLELSAAELQELFGEIAVSCALMGEMADRVKSLLSPASEPAHVFRRDAEAGNDRR